VWTQGYSLTIRFAIPERVLSTVVPATDNGTICKLSVLRFGPTGDAAGRYAVGSKNAPHRRCRLLWTLGMKQNSWVRLLTYITGLVNQELLLQNEYLAAENRILRAQLPARLRLSDLERTTLAEIGKRLGRKTLDQVACVAKPDTILAWYRKLIAQKFDGSKRRSYPGRPRIDPKLEALIIRMAQENSSGGTTALPVPWRISATTFLTRRWETCSNAMASLRQPSEAKIQPGRSLFDATWP